ncbi:hypothetical protein F2P56_018359 [Juglans regia]|uniref:Retrotransposon Copia-like N-terminal domain-containing protein n=1 Tax=Juglans regia TaxID=51240 RepID=A0A833X772_JUGRE|nr:hypothetical protein F2P56_018359 [Juglans regia]
MASTPITLVSIHSLVTIKLTKDNYLLWKAQIEPYLRGQRLFGFVDGSITQPPTHISNSEAATSGTAPSEIPNPTYTVWFDQDQVVLNTLVSFLSKNILAQMVGISTSREVWVALETIISSPSQDMTLLPLPIVSYLGPHATTSPTPLEDPETALSHLSSSSLAPASLDLPSASASHPLSLPSPPLTSSTAPEPLDLDVAVEAPST